MTLRLAVASRLLGGAVDSGGVEHPRLLVASGHLVAHHNPGLAKDISLLPVTIAATDVWKKLSPSARECCQGALAIFS